MCWWWTIRRRCAASSARSCRQVDTASMSPRPRMASSQSKTIETRPFDLVFLDYNMPGLDGIETLAEIKRLNPRTTVVIMTLMADAKLAERAYELGAAAFLKKPFYPSDINATLKST